MLKSNSGSTGRGDTRPDLRIQMAIIDTLELRLAEEQSLAPGRSRAYRSLWVKLRCGPLWGHGEAIADPIDEPLRELRSLHLLGESVFDLPRILEPIEHPAARAAIDLALHDLIGKAHRLPLRHWRGLPRRLVPVALSLGHLSPSELIEKIRRFLRADYSVWKFVLGPDTDAALLRALRSEIGSSARYWVDAHQGWTDTLTQRLAPVLRDTGALFIKQPLPGEQLREYRSLRPRLGLPIILDEAVVTPADVIRAVRAEGIDGIDVNLSKCGGVVETLRCIEVARAAGLMVQLSGCAEGQVSTSAAAHLQGLVDYLDLDESRYVQSKPHFRGASEEGRLLRPATIPGNGARLSDCTRS
ncbi:MAG: hypothetical protein IT349_16135 [Candidatus Eisenbacteria bacterium]|nr:hypothetical protein [Candidatus Eisenbacteria bacterium]MCC7143629.1 hypothetical protein [Candidatus Eisenbacteria bacterium]